MRIRLYLVKEYQRVILVTEIVAGNCAKLQIEILFASYRGKDAFALLVGFQVYLYKMLEQILSDMPYQIRLANLSCTINKEYFSRFLGKEFFQSFRKLPL